MHADLCGCSKIITRLQKTSLFIVRCSADGIDGLLTDLGGSHYPDRFRKRIRDHGHRSAMVSFLRWAAPDAN
jgi:hypothetical protein